MAKGKAPKLVYVYYTEVYKNLKNLYEFCDEGQKIDIYQFVKTQKLVTDTRLEDVKS